MELITWVIPVAGLAAVLFALYLARDVLSRDTGTQAMQDVGDTIREGADAFVRRQYTTIALLALVGAVIIGVVIGVVETPDVADVPDLGRPPDRDHDRGRLPRRRGLLDGVGHHRHVHQRALERAHRRRRPAQPGRGRPGRHARRRRLRLPGGRPLAARRVGHLHRLRDAHRRRDGRRRRRSSSSASASAPASSPSSPSSAAGSTPRPPTSAPTWSARSRRASRRTTRATRPSSPTSSATTSATAPAVAPTCSSRPPPRTSAP